MSDRREFSASLWRWSAGTDARADWSGRSEIERLAILAGARDFGCGALLYYYLGDLLPAPAAEEFRAAYRAQAMQAIKQQYMLGEIGAVLARAGIDSIPIKGAYLAQEIYPAPALRPMGDLDVLIEKKRLPEALKLLQNAHWVPGYLADGHNHAPMMFRDRVALEPHFALPGMAASETGKVWDYWRSNQRKFPIELHFLILAGHAWQHRWRNARKFLPDLGFLLARGPLDPDKVEALRREFGFCRPDLLYHALPELFPPETRQNGSIPQDAVRSLRRLLFEPVDLSGRGMEIMMHDPRRFSWPWWRRRLQGFAPARVMDKYQAGWPRLPLCYGREIALKFAAFRQGVSAPPAPEVFQDVNDNEAVSACMRP